MLKYPSAHHALHLSTVRKRCEGDGSKIMKHLSDRSIVKKIIENGIIDVQFSSLEEASIDDEMTASGTDSAALSARAKQFIIEK